MYDDEALVDEVFVIEVYDDEASVKVVWDVVDL